MDNNERRPDVPCQRRIIAPDAVNMDFMPTGIQVPVVGRVCMDFTMIDVGTVPGVQVGEEVIILGNQGDVNISAEDIAELCDTINYEVVASLTRRMPIRYTHGKENK